jgi:hypothetical protein
VICSNCHRRKAAPYSVWCRKCCREYLKKWVRQNYGKHHKYQLKHKFGLAYGGYEALLVAQHGVCAICTRPERSKRFKHFAVDHDAETGQIRGLLCAACNQAIGLLSHDVNILRRASSYLQKFNRNKTKTQPTKPN